MSTERTPGNWRWARDAVPEGHVQFTVYAEDTGNRVATVFDSEANVPLIVSAPKLLEALERAFVALGRAGGNVAGGPYRAEWEQARDAIAKATQL